MNDHERLTEIYDIITTDMPILKKYKAFLKLKKALLLPTVEDYLLSDSKTSIYSPLDLIFTRGYVDDLIAYIRAYNEIFVNNKILSYKDLSKYILNKKGSCCVAQLRCSGEIVCHDVIEALFQYNSDFYRYLAAPDSQIRQTICDIILEMDKFFNTVIMVAMHYPNKLQEYLKLCLNKVGYKSSIPNIQKLLAYMDKYKDIPTMCKELGIKLKYPYVNCDCVEEYLFKQNINELDPKFCDKCESQHNNLVTLKTIILNDTYNLVKIYLKKDAKSSILPQEIYKELDVYVQGQDDVKKELATVSASYIRYMSLKDKDLSSTTQTFVSLIAGPTGTGKSYTVSKLAEILNIPFIKVSADSLSPAGYKGVNLDECVDETLYKVNMWYNKNGKGVFKTYKPYILFIDEFDKLLTGTDDTISFRKSVQASLLNILEDGLSNKNSQVDVRYPLIVIAGSFMHSRGQNDRKDRTTTIGFSKNLYHKDEAKKISYQDLINYGLLPELVGRIASITETQALTKEEFRKILLEKKDSALLKLLELCETFDIILSESETSELIDKATEQAISRGTGARALHSILWELLKDKFFNATRNT